MNNLDMLRQHLNGAIFLATNQTLRRRELAGMTAHNVLALLEVKPLESTGDKWTYAFESLLRLKRHVV